MKIKLTFHGPNTIATAGTKTGVGFVLDSPITLTTDLLDESTKLKDLKRFWDMERAFNELTRGRLHVEVLE